MVPSSTFRSLLLLLHDAVVLMFQNPCLCEKMGLFQSNGRALQSLFQSAGIPAVLALLLPEASQGVLLARLLVSNLASIYNHHYVRRGVRDLLVPVLTQAVVGVAFPLAVTRWIIRAAGRDRRSKASKEQSNVVAASIPTTSPAVPAYVPQTRRCRPASTIKARLCWGSGFSRLSRGSPGAGRGLPMWASMWSSM